MASLTAVLPRVMQDGRTVPTDDAHALILELAQLQPGDKVLEVGTGSGTTARVLQHALCACACEKCHETLVDGVGLPTEHCNNGSCTQGLEVHTLELEPVYGEVLAVNGEPIYFHKRDGRFGLQAEAPFDVIVATCGVTKVPDAWEQQLKDGGRLVCPLGEAAAQRLVLCEKRGQELKLVRVRAYVRFSMMR